MRLAKTIALDFRRCAHEEIARVPCLRKCDHLANVQLVRENHDETVDAGSHSAVWRSAILERFQQMPKTGLDEVMRQAEYCALYSEDRVRGCGLILDESSYPFTRS